MDLKKGDGSETFALHALVGLRETLVDDVDFELHHRAQRNIVRHRRHKSRNHLVDVVVAGVLDRAELRAPEIGRAAHKVLGRETEQPGLRVFFLALGVGVEYQIDNFLVQPPRRGEVEFEIAARHFVAAGVVHSKGNLAYRGAAVVLGYRAPCVAERVDAVAVVAVYAYALADFLYAAVGVAAKAVGVAVTLVKAEQVGVVGLGGILVEQR